MDRIRCSWANLDDPLMVKYHDEEYGVKQSGFVAYFEKLCLESFQAGLSWRTVLHKREAFRKAFYGFDPYTIAKMTKQDIESLMQNQEIIRNKRKITAVIENAWLAIEIEKEQGFENFINTFQSGEHLCSVLKSKGFSFVGNTICESYLMSIGLLPAHEPCCYKYDL